MTTISLISAMAKNRVIGVNNTIPWHISGDFKYFKDTTMGCPLVMGRKTFESLPGILPGRPHIVVSRSDKPDEIPSDKPVTFVKSLESGIEQARELLDQNGKDEIFIIGGGQIYDLALQNNLANRIYLTEINISVDGDAFFPAFDQDLWQEIARQDIVSEPSYSFVVYEKLI